jgi:tripartite-type tricarboxylate transporter receptor subunit TctC
VKRKFLKSLGGLLVGTLLGGGSALAQDYPAQSIRLVVPFPPAGVADILGRMVSQRLGAQYGQTLVVDNRPGASGHLGAQVVAKAPPDGYTLMVGTIGIHAAYASYSKLNYSPATELQPVMILGEAPNIVLVPASSPFRTFAELLAFIKANPGKLNYASAGPGSSVHMVTALFELESGTRMNHVPYKGSGPALIDLIGGQVDVMFDNMSSSVPHIQSGKLRALAVTSARRNPQLPNIPTIAESGVPGYAGTSWWTLAVPAGTPPAIIDKLNRDVLRVVAAPDAQKQLDALGVAITPHTPAEAQAYFKSETAKWGRVIEAARLKLD